MKVLVTGGAGFIGSHLAEHLLDAGHSVLAVDDLSTGSVENVSGLQGRDGFELRVGDVTDSDLMKAAVDASDSVVHLAAAVGVRLIIEKPVHTIQTNVHGTQVVLNAAIALKKPVLIASTSEVYGKSTKIPFSEDDDLVLGPTRHSRWAYACSKALDEWLALAYATEHGLPVTVVRLFNTVGPRQSGRYGMVLPNFVRQALAGEKITVFGTGTQSRCFSHVRDVVRALELLMHTPAARGGVYNIGGAEEITIQALAEKVREHAGSTSQIVNVPYEQAYASGFEDMMRRVPCVSKLQATIGFVPDTPLDRIVVDVIDEHRRAM